MPKTTITIYRVFISLTARKYVIGVTPVETNESPKSYIWAGTRLDKSKIGKIDTVTHEWIGFYRYFCYCLAPDIETTKQKLIGHVNNKWAADYAQMQLMKSNHEVGPSHDDKEPNYYY